jgi:hypothetical protein
VYVVADCVYHFVADSHINHIPSRFTLIMHNGDQSTPDGQNDVRGLGRLSSLRLCPTP